MGWKKKFYYIEDLLTVKQEIADSRLLSVTCFAYSFFFCKRKFRDDSCPRLTPSVKNNRHYWGKFYNRDRNIILLKFIYEKDNITYLKISCMYKYVFCEAVCTISVFLRFHHRSTIKSCIKVLHYFVGLIQIWPIVLLWFLYINLTIKNVIQFYFLIFWYIIHIIY